MGASVSSGDDDVITDINVTPLVDVVLVLLIVFMITMPKIVGGAKVTVDLPETSAAGANTEDIPFRLQLQREASGQVQLYRDEQPVTEDQLRAQVAKEGTGQGDVFLAADKGIPYGEVVKVMDLLADMGLHKINLDTKHIGR